MLNRYLTKKQADTLFSEYFTVWFESPSDYSIVDNIETDFGWICVYDVLEHASDTANFKKGMCCFVTYGGALGGCPDPRKKGLYEWSMEGFQKTLDNISTDLNNHEYHRYYDDKNLVRFGYKPPRSLP